jgi:uncharacterized cupin superfamily protein
MANIYRPRFDEGHRPDGFRARRSRIGYELGLELIGCSLWELPAGEAAYPYHFHYADEELIVVMRGRPTLRTPQGLRELEEGEALRFPVSEQGAHQIVNRSEDTVTFLAISSHGRLTSSNIRTPGRSVSASGCRAEEGCVSSFGVRMPSATGTASKAVSLSAWWTFGSN